MADLNVHAVLCSVGYIQLIVASGPLVYSRMARLCPKDPTLYSLMSSISTYILVLEANTSSVFRNVRGVSNIMVDKGSAPVCMSSESEAFIGRFIPGWCADLVSDSI